MHEVSIMEQTLDLAIHHAQRQGATQIHHITLRIGQMSGVVPEALFFAFDVVTAGTMAHQAQLSIERVPVQCHCDRCDRAFIPDDVIYQCPHCGHITHRATQGTEIELANLEIS